MKILGTKFFGHDNSIFYIDTDKQEIFAISVERLTRIKHDRSSIKRLIEEYPFILDFDVVCHGYALADSISSYEELLILDEIQKKHHPKYIKELSIIKNDKKKLFLLYVDLGLKNILSIVLGNIVSLLNKEKGRLFARQKIDRYYCDLLGAVPNQINRYDHHLCHALSAYVFSPNNQKHKCISLTIDGFGDGCFSKVFIFDENGNFELIGSSSTNEGYRTTRTSIGLMYSAFTRALGLIPDSDEGKVEALAAFAKADEKLLNELTSLIHFQDLNILFDRHKNHKMRSKSFLSKKRKLLGDEVFAATIQTWLEEIMVDYLNRVYKHTGVERLCLSGGVAANIIMSLNLYERTPFENIYVFPAMADDGIAAGGALEAARQEGIDLSWIGEKYHMPYLGMQHSVDDVIKVLKNSKDITFEELGDAWPEEAGRAVSSGKVISIFHGRDEYGPRALGNRSIVANPTDAQVKDKINKFVKKRPKYQPFCPSILEEERIRLFEQSFAHKYMAIAFRMKEKFWHELPSAIHIDGTARPQFVEKNDNPKYYRLIKEVKKQTGFGVVINTSFNLHGRAMVHKPEDAIRDFIDCSIDELYLEGFKVVRLPTS
jgi:carbamoyltransferase